MLTKCPECDLPVSDKAVSCPHCGYPLKSDTVKHARKKPNKRRRLPNGFGQISELKGMNLRKPFRAMVTVGKTDEGRPICKLLQPEAYFKTYNDAYQALMEYNRNPYLFNNGITVQELFESWSNKTSEEWSESYRNSVRTTWRYCESIKNIKVLEIRPRHIRYCIEEGSVSVNGINKTASPGIKTKIKSLLNQLFDYAVEYELIDKNPSRNVKLSKSDIKEKEENTEHHIPYTDEEIELLWKNITMPGADVILIQCYSGWRPLELEQLEIKNINLEEETMEGGVKTRASKNRIVPIHPKIKTLIEKRYRESVSLNSKYLLTFTGTLVRNKTTDEIPYTYRRYHTDLKNIIEKLGLNPNHKPHDGRAHFITQAKKYNMDEYALKRIVGHKITDITESVYTTRDIDWLKTEMEKIK